MKLRKIKLKISPMQIVLGLFLVLILVIILYLLFGLPSVPSYQDTRRYLFFIIPIVFFGAVAGGYAYKYRREIWEELKILNLKRRVRKGDKKYKKERFLLAYEIYHTALYEAKKLHNSRNFVDKISQIEEKTLEKLSGEIKSQTDQFLTKLEKLKERNNHSHIIEVCKKFLQSLGQYPVTAEIEKQRERIIKEYNFSIEKVYEAQYNEIRLKIRKLLQNKDHEKAIERGKQFLTTIKTYPDIKGVRLARDGIIMLIEPPITQKWRAEYDKLRPDIKVPGTPQEFQTAYAKINAFLLKSEDDKDFSGVEALRSKVQNRLENIRTMEPRVRTRDKYETFVSKAQNNFNWGFYQRAIYLTQKAIEVVKDPHSEIINIIVNHDTKTHVVLAQFKFYCQDKITESNIVKLITKATELYNEGNLIESKAKLQIALELHTQLSDIFKNIEPRRHRELYEQIRQGLNRE